MQLEACIHRRIRIRYYVEIILYFFIRQKHYPSVHTKLPP